MMRTRRRTRPVAGAAMARGALPTMGSPTRLLDPALTDDLQPETFEADVDRCGRVGKQHHVADAQVPEDLRADADLDEAALLGPAAVLCGLGAACDPVRHRIRPQVADQHKHAAPLGA